jgi:hypothetical protein
MGIIFGLFVAVVTVAFATRIAVGVVAFFYNNCIPMFLLTALGLFLVASGAGLGF